MAIAASGCGGGNEPSGAYTSADVEQLATIAPVTPDLPAWPEKPKLKKQLDESPEEVAARDPVYAAYRRRTRDLESEDNWGSGNKWVDEGKLGNLVVAAFDTPEDAHVSFLASNDLSRGYGRQYGFVVKVENVEGLGDEAWRLWAHGNGRQVTYHWRRDNLVVEVHVHCYGDCPRDEDASVDAAARSWAEAVDAKARSVLG